MKLSGLQNEMKTEKNIWVYIIHKTIWSSIHDLFRKSVRVFFKRCRSFWTDAVNKSIAQKMCRINSPINTQWNNYGISL